MNERTSNQTARRRISPYFIALFLIAFSSFLLAQSFTVDRGAIIRGPHNIQPIALVFTGDAYGEGLGYILSVLDARKSQGSFFITGKFLSNEEFKWQVKKIVSEGHYLGPHSSVSANPTGTAGNTLAVQQTTDADIFSPYLTEIWSVKSPGKVSGLAVAKDRIFWAMDDGQTYLARAQSGCLIKSLKFGSGVLSQLTSSKNGFWLTSGNRLIGLNPDGQVILELGLSGALSQPPVEDNGQLFLVIEKRLEALTPDSGKKLWTVNLPAASSGFLNFTPSILFVPLVSGQVIGLNRKTGQKTGDYEFREEAASMAVIEGKKLVLGSATGKVLCFDLGKKKISWKINTGSQRIEHFLAHGKRIYTLTSGGLLYTLKQSGGDILQWQIIPGRTFFRPAIFQDEIIIPSSGKAIFGFDLKTGKKSSETELSFEIKTDPLVAGDLLIIGAYDYSQDYSVVYALKKEPQIVIRPSRESPQPAGQRIVFTVLTAGFEKPKYEFYLRSPDGQERLARKASKLNTWTWIPAEPGDYTVIVRVFDKNLSKKIELRYNISSFN